MPLNPDVPDVVEGEEAPPATRWPNPARAFGRFVSLAVEQGTRLVDELQKMRELYERDVKAREYLAFGKRPEEDNDEDG